MSGGNGEDHPAVGIALVSVGTNGGVAWTRPATVPARSDLVLVNHTDYNAAGHHPHV